MIFFIDFIAFSVPQEENAAHYMDVFSSSEIKFLEIYTHVMNGEMLNSFEETKNFFGFICINIFEVSIFGYKN